MTTALLTVLGVLFLTEPGQIPEASASAPKSSAKAASRTTTISSALVTSRSCDLDGAAGVILFEGDVSVRYSEEFAMGAEKVYMFLAGSNDVSRVVAIGGVSITNGTRVGRCDMATYRRRKGEIEMIGNGGESVARLDEKGERAHSVVGSRIVFWLDSEQVRVEDSRLFSERPKGGSKL